MSRIKLGLTRRYRVRLVERLHLGGSRIGSNLRRKTNSRINLLRVHRRTRMLR